MARAFHGDNKPIVQARKSRRRHPEVALVHRQPPQTSHRIFGTIGYVQAEGQVRRQDDRRPEKDSMRMWIEIRTDRYGAPI